ncbi:MAG: dehydrogenase [Lysobacteraceae bacterium]|nr:MAG: dehydrogenase [Xanthomonadaceae bacterium]
MTRTALITGASAGIGLAFAERYASMGINTVLVARREQRLQQLANELESRTKTSSTALAMDLADPTAIDGLVAELANRQLHIDILVNNAGYGVNGKLTSRDWQDHRQFIELMMVAPVELSYRLLPAMREQGYGRILNIASLAGLIPSGAGHTLYGASKAYLIRFSEALSAECVGTGVNVAAICPGFTYSEFHDVTGTRDQVSKMPSWMWMTAEEVVEMSVAGVEQDKVVLVTGRVNRFLAWLARHLPPALARRLVNARSKDFRDQSE